MSQAFYERFLSVLFGFILLLIFLIGSSEFLILYLLQPENPVYYSGYFLLVAASGIFGIKYYREYRGFKESIVQGLFEDNNSKAEANLEALDIDVEDTALKVCLWYRNGATFNQIKDSLGLDHPTAVKRLLVKGLDFLLKEHGEK